MRKVAYSIDIILLLLVLAVSLPVIPSAFSKEAKPAPAVEPPAVVKTGESTPVDKIHVPKGYQIELVYEVPRDQQGSWVSLTTDSKGRLITSDQYGKLYRITPKGINGNSGKAIVKVIDLKIGMAQGLLFWKDALYVMVSVKSPGRPTGLYRVTDTDNDDAFDKIELLREISQGSEHGPHSIVVSPDKKSLYINAGNMTKLPSPETSLVPKLWKEDQLLPRMWDARGHAAGKLAPGGWICKIDPDGKNCQLVTSGFRNEFDIAFNPEGELFSFDADMEWDVGAPWYRPTRVCHAIPSGEFGWRSGTGKFPEFYPDNLPSVIDIGLGSPTGIVFGTGAKFPAAQQKSLFVSDWSYGIIYDVTLKPEGSTYKGTKKEFVTGVPLPVTDLVINPQDGAMYFAIGGRRTQSALYKVSYIGEESTEPAPETRDSLYHLRQQRRELQAMLTAKPDQNVIAKAWLHLSNGDRFIRFAARSVIEMQPLEMWKERVFSEQNPQGILTAAIALARTGSEADRGTLLKKLAELDWEKLDAAQRLDLLRAYGLTFTRLGKPTAEEKTLVVNEVGSQFPSANVYENQELCRLLCYLDAPGIWEKTLKLLLNASTQEEQIHYVYCLRPIAGTATPAQQATYFTWFNTASQHRGGLSLTGFMSNIQKEALANLSDEQKKPLKEILAVKPSKELYAVDPNRKHVKKWTIEELLPKLEDENFVKERDFAQGKKMFSIAGCYKCHRLQRQGGTAGPDLTAIGRRFNNRALLESLIEPSKEVSEQYQTTIFVLTSGKSLTGRIANLSKDEYRVMTNMLDPGTFTRIQRKDILKSQRSTVSMMPVGLLETLSEKEILDLIFYLKSGGIQKQK